MTKVSTQHALGQRPSTGPQHSHTEADQPTPTASPAAPSHGSGRFTGHRKRWTGALMDSSGRVAVSSGSARWISGSENGARRSDLWTKMIRYRACKRSAKRTAAEDLLGHCFAVRGPWSVPCRTAFPVVLGDLYEHNDIFVAEVLEDI